MNTAILWDIENVTPPRGTNYIQLIVDTISEEGKISYAMAFGDWNRNNIKNIASELAANSFELIHVPASRKDSSDMSMVTHGVELIFQYPHIEKFVLITGDADFRPLLLSLRKYGKRTQIICDVTKNASEDLLKMADDFKDYRDIIDDADSADNSGDDENGSNRAEKLTKERAFELLEDTVDIMEKEGKTPHLGAVKIRMKLLNSGFDEKKLGYRTWKAFINDALKFKGLRYADEDGNILAITEHAQKGLPEVFNLLLGILDGDKPMLFNEAAKKINYRDYGYGRFKQLALDAEKRGIVKLGNRGLSWYLSRV